MGRRRRLRRESAPRPVGRVVGRVRIGPVVGRVRPVDRAPTEVTHLDDLPVPVFADAGGTRRRRLRRLSYAVGVLLVLLLVAFWLSRLGVGLR